MSAPKQKLGGQELGIFAAVIIGLAAFMWFTSGADPTLRNGPTGFDGLNTWLKKNDIQSDIVTFRRPVTADQIGLRILPLYDTDLDKKRSRATTEEEHLHQIDEYDIAYDVLIEKQRRAPTLVIYPKWRAGMRLTGNAHPDLLIPANVLNRDIANGIRRYSGRLSRPEDPLNELNHFENGFLDVPYGDNGLKARLYEPQLLSVPSRCMPIIGDHNGMVLGVCRHHFGDKGDSVWVLSDPDLLNNHGLSLGDNAAIASQVLSEIAGDKRIFIDYTDYNWAQFGRSKPREHDRTWADLGRFFGPPFDILWIGVGILAALLLWRAWLRYGAAVRLFDDGPGAAKRVAVESKARLLRLSGHDGALVAAHAEQRLQTIAAALFGPHRPTGKSSLNTITAYIARRDKDLSAEFQAKAHTATTLLPYAPVNEALHALQEFEQVAERVTNDLGRTSRGG